MNEPEILDQGALARLREWGGEKLLGQMIRLFLENSPARMEQIRGGVTSGDVGESEKGAHSLKSSAANVGAMRVRDIATEMERVAGGGDAAGVQALLPSLETAFGEAIGALETVERGLNA